METLMDITASDCKSQLDLSFDFFPPPSLIYVNAKISFLSQSQPDKCILKYPRGFSNHVQNVLPPWQVDCTYSGFVQPCHPPLSITCFHFSKWATEPVNWV